MGWGEKALENDELEGRQGLGARAVHRIKEFIRLQQGASMRGHCSRWRGWQGGWQNQGWERSAGRTRDVSKTRQLRSTGGDGGTQQLCQAVLEGPDSARKGQQFLWSVQAGRGSWHAQRTR